MGRDSSYPSEYTQEVAQNAIRTVAKINEFLSQSGFAGYVNSGWRPPSLNAKVAGAAPRSKHMLGLACDLADHDGSIDQYCTNEVLEAFGLWREAPESTIGWCHLQIVQYGSWVPGKLRTFKP